MTERGPHDGRPPLGHVPEWEDLAVDYVAGRLPPEQQTAVERHLDSCAICRAEVESQREVASLLAAVPLSAPPPALESAALEAYLQGSAIAATTAGRPTSATPRETRTLWRRLLDGLDGRMVRRLAPVMAAVLLFAVGIAGLSQLSTDDLEMAATPTTAAASATTAAAALAETQPTDESRADESVAGPASGSDATASQTATTAATASSEAGGEGAGVGATPPPPVSTTMAAPAGTVPGGGEKTSLNAMAAYAAPVAYVNLEPTTGSGATAGEIPVDPSTLVEQMTGLTPLESGLWLGGPTFAAFISTRTLDLLVDDLRRAGALALRSSKPPPGTGGQAAAVAESGGYPVLEAVKASDEPHGYPGDSQAELVLLVIVAAR